MTPEETTDEMTPKPSAIHLVIDPYDLGDLSFAGDAEAFLDACIAAVQAAYPETLVSAELREHYGPTEVEIETDYPADESPTDLEVRDVIRAVWDRGAFWPEAVQG